MKRGLIAWDRTALPPAVFDSRLARVRAAIAERNLPALLVYTDVWRSNQARFLTNFMPYWNRSLVVIPVDKPPVLLCALSPRVYPWIKSVTIFEEIRPASKLMVTLEQLCAERGWSKLGALDAPKFPRELLKPEFVDVPSDGIMEPDAAEFSVRRRAATLARKVLQDQLAAAGESNATAFVGHLEREFRMAGAEDLVIRLRPGSAGAYSVAVALEYCGNWVKVTRAHASPEAVAALRENFAKSLTSGDGNRENLSGPQPYESGTGPIFALQVGHQGLYYGDTCTGTEIL